MSLEVESSGQDSNGLILFESFHEKSIVILARYSSFFSATSSRAFAILVGIICLYTGTHKGRCYLFNHRERSIVKNSRVQFPIHSQFFHLDSNEATEIQAQKNTDTALNSSLLQARLDYLFRTAAENALYNIIALSGSPYF